MLLTNEQIDRFVDGVRSSVKWRELNENHRLKWLVRLVEKRISGEIIREMRMKWNPQKFSEKLMEI